MTLDSRENELKENGGSHNLRKFNLENHVRFVIVGTSETTVTSAFDGLLDRRISFVDKESFRNELLHFLEHDSKDLVEKLLRFFGFGRSLAPLICFVYYEKLQESELASIRKVIKEVSNRTYVYLLLIGCKPQALGNAQGVVSPELVASNWVVDSMKSIVDSSSLHRKESNIRGLLKWLYERLLLLFFFPVLVGLASGIGEGFITRQVPQDRFVLYLDMLGLYVILVSLCFFLLPFVLLYVFLRVLRD
ncbi:MAG: hypothetical protein LW850_15665 [Planctomycetaceae bacterium]|nr:hypothetical protein [Planctomycetaceae bacterium]